MARPNIPLLQIPAFANNTNIERMNTPRGRFNSNNNNNFGPRRINFTMNENANANIYAGRPHMGNRNLGENAENAILMENIEDEDEMVNFHGESALAEPRYYKKSTFNSLPKNRNGTKKNPFTRARIRANNVEFYRARKAEGGRRRKTRRRKIRKH